MNSSRTAQTQFDRAVLPALTPVQLAPASHPLDAIGEAENSADHMAKTADSEKGANAGVELAAEDLQRLLAVAQPWAREGTQPLWRFVRMRQLALRSEIEMLLRNDPLASSRSAQALQQAAEVLVVVLPPGGPGVPGAMRLDVAVVAQAIQALWLAARAQGLGMGWLAGFDPAAMSRLLALPAGSQPVGLLCLGGLPLGLHALDAPALPAVQAAHRVDAATPQWYEDRWGQRPGHTK